MENVKGMLKVANQVIEDYENIIVNKNGHTYSYRASYRLLNSADFSVAQSRERLIYVAIRNDISEELNIRPDDVFERISNNNKEGERYILRETPGKIYRF